MRLGRTQAQDVAAPSVVTLTVPAGPRQRSTPTLALIGVLMSVYLTLHKFGFIGTLACGTGAKR